VNDSDEATRRFSRLYSELYALFHRPESKRNSFTPESMAVLEHLRLAGPLTVGEAARHMERAQSVMSEIITRLESKGLLCRLRDQRDARRVLVWLTPAGQQVLDDQAQILCSTRLQAALTRMNESDRATLFEKLELLLRSTMHTPHKKGRS
jgi:DNA-binding MarR family transcriptional regulator